MLSELNIFRDINLTKHDNQPSTAYCYRIFFCSCSSNKQSQKGTNIDSFQKLQTVTMSDQPIAALIVDNQKTRIKDAWGRGLFREQRDGGTRRHNGLDVVANVGDKIYAPFEGDIVREAVPYRNDPSYRGVVLKGVGAWEGYEAKIFYVEGQLSGRVSKGQTIGTAQNLTIKYPNITNHVHIEVKRFSTLIDPFEIWQMSID